MSKTFERILSLIRAEKILVSDHGYDELANDDISVRDVVSGAVNGDVIEDYPEYHKGPCLLLLQYDSDGEPLHIVWGIPLNKPEPAVVVTAYRPDVERWSSDFRTRK